MARYMILTAAYVAGIYYPGPGEITVDKGTEPSRKWQPLDKEAEADMAALLAKDSERAAPNQAQDVTTAAAVKRGKAALAVPAGPSPEDQAIIDQIGQVTETSALYAFQVEGRSDYVENAINAKGMELLKAAQAAA